MITVTGFVRLAQGKNFLLFPLFCLRKLFSVYFACVGFAFHELCKGQQRTQSACSCCFFPANQMYSGFPPSPTQTRASHVLHQRFTIVFPRSQQVPGFAALISTYVFLFWIPIGPPAFLATYLIGLANWVDPETSALTMRPPRLKLTEITPINQWSTDCFSCMFVVGHTAALEKGFHGTNWEIGKFAFAFYNGLFSYDGWCVLAMEMCY